MKYALLILCVLLIQSFLGQETGKEKGNFWLRHFVENQADTVENVGLFVKASESDARSFIEENGGIYRGSVKGWQYIRIPGKSVKELLIDDRFSYIDYAPYKGVPMNDTMRVNNRINDIHAGTSPLATGFTGNSTILGFIDTGIDFLHPDFRTANDRTRVLHLWDQTKSNNAFTPVAYGYGRHWDSTQINNGLSNHTDPWGHGTTVTGAAAGNALANGTHMGVAPDSYIISVESKFNASDWLATVVDATEYIYSYADLHDLPCAINASVGTYLGSHDGLDPYALYIDSLILSKRGRLFAASAGNSGDWEKYHLHTDVTTDTLFTWFEYNSTGAFGVPSAFWELWADTADFNQVSYAIGADKVSPNFEFRGRTAFIDVAANLNVLLEDTIRNSNNDIIATVQTWAELRDGQYLVQVYMPTPDSSDYYFRFETVGSGSYDVWSVADYGMSRIIDTIPSVIDFPEIVNYVNPDTLQSIVSSFQCSPNVITVANYANDSGYVNKFGNWIPKDYPRGELYLSSSKGPSRQGLVKPEVAATGHITLSAAPLTLISSWIGSGVDSVLAYGGMHMSNGGTSMASPIVAGVGSLLLEKCPTLSQTEFIAKIIENTYTDGFMGASLPNSAWGYGKLDGFATVTSTNYTPLYSGNTYFCQYDSTQISLEPSYSSVLWEGGNTAFDSIFTTTDTSFVSTIDIAGCLSDLLHLFLIERTPPLVNQITSPYYHCDGDSASITISGPDLTSVLWQDGSTDMTRYLIGDQTQFLFGIDSANCLSDTAWISVVSNPLPSIPVLYHAYDSLVATSGFVQYDWNLDGSFLSTTNMDSVLIASQNGSYVVTVTDVNGCSQNSSPYVYNSVEVNDLTNSVVHIFPNPTQGSLTISSSFTANNVEITNALGQVVYTQIPNSNLIQIDLKYLPNGVYFVTISTSQKDFVHKIVLNK